MNLYQWLEQLKKQLKQLLQQLNVETNKDKLYRVAKENIGKDLSDIQSQFGCAKAVNTIHRLAFGNEIGGGASTYLLFKALGGREDFQEIAEYEVGAIIISPTGTQSLNSRLQHGHTGICGKNCIMSDNSLTGLLDTQWTKSTWEKFFGVYGGFPIYYFRKI